MKDKYDRYSGALELEEIAIGVNACLKNARALIREATILYIFRRYARALMCISVAFEEIGKADILLIMSRIPQQDEASWKYIWKEFRSHKSKGAHAAIQTVPDSLRTTFDSIFGVLPRAAEIGSYSERQRQTSLYVDFDISSRKWLSPLRISRHEVRYKLIFVRSALKRMDSYEKMGFFSVKALRIVHEEMSQVISDLPQKKEPSNSDVKNMEPIVRRCVKRLINEMGIRYPDDVTIMGEPWREFVKE